MKRFRKRGQNVAEYAILIALVIAAAVGMQLYVKRGLQARSQAAIHYLANATPEIDSAIANLQYEPYYFNSAYEVKQASGSTMNINTGTTYIESSVNVERPSGYQGYANADAAD